MKIYIGADHRGFKLKEKLSPWLSKIGKDHEDLGAFDYNSIDDYPIIAKKVAEKVAQEIESGNTDTRGIIMCGSGVGVDIAANKIKNIRSGLGMKASQIRKAREDDDINILALPSDYLSVEEAMEITTNFLNTPFVKKETHERRIEEIKKLENE